MLQQFDTGNHWIRTRIGFPLVIQANRLTKCASHPKFNRDVKCEVKDFRLCFVCPCTLFMGVWSQCPQIYLMLKYPKTGINQPLDDHGLGVTSHLMGNLELKTQDCFLCVPALDLGYLGLALREKTPYLDTFHAM